MDPLYLSILVSAEKKFWRCVQSGEVPHLIMAEPPRPRIEAIRIVDMSSSNSWAEFAGLFRNTRQAFLDHERASKNRAQGSSCRRTSKRRPKAPLGRKFPLRARSPWRRHPFAALAT
jgi:hypothetical protein